MSSRITYCKDIYYFQVFLLVPAKGLRIYICSKVTIRSDLNINILPIYVLYTVKSVIQYYNYYNSPVYTCFLDASKAFDRLNH